MEKIFQIIEANQQKYIDFLCQICSYEARAYDKEIIDDMVDYISTFAQNEGFQVTRTPMEKCGDFLTVEINEGAPKGCLFQAHMDTVHEKGVFGQPAAAPLLATPKLRVLLPFAVWAPVAASSIPQRNF